LLRLQRIADLGEWINDHLARAHSPVEPHKILLAKMGWAFMKMLKVKTKLVQRQFWKGEGDIPLISAEDIEGENRWKISR
jgi:hypothetical protein